MKHRIIMLIHRALDQEPQGRLRKARFTTRYGNTA